jgi:hypothetical protein
VRQDRPEPGQQHPGTPIPQPDADREQPPGRTQPGQPGHENASDLRSARHHRVDERREFGKQREERQVRGGQAAVGLQRYHLVVAALHDAGVVHGVIPGERLEQAAALRGREVPENRKAHGSQAAAYNARAGHAACAPT